MSDEALASSRVSVLAQEEPQLASLDLERDHETADQRVFQIIA
jgi:hypothetical protein